MGRFPFVPRGSALAVAQMRADLAVPKPQVVATYKPLEGKASLEETRGNFVFKPANKLTRLPNGAYAYTTDEGPPLDAGLAKPLDSAGFDSPYFRDESTLDNLAARWVEAAQERSKLRRCKPMIARLRKALGEKIAREQHLQADEFRKCLHESNHVDAGDFGWRGFWAGVYHNGPAQARDLAIDLEIWNALQ